MLYPTYNSDNTLKATPDKPTIDLYTHFEKSDHLYTVSWYLNENDSTPIKSVND